MPRISPPGHYTHNLVNTYRMIQLNGYQANEIALNWLVKYARGLGFKINLAKQSSLPNSPEKSRNYQVSLRLRGSSRYFDEGDIIALKGIFKEYKYQLRINKPNFVSAGAHMTNYRIISRPNTYNQMDILVCMDGTNMLAPN